MMEGFLKKMEILRISLSGGCKYPTLPQKDNKEKEDDHKLS